MLTLLSPDQCAQAGAVLGRAFRNDPLWEATLSDPDQRPRLLVSMFTGLSKATVAAHGLAETTAKIDAVALWLPPGKSFGFRALFGSGFALPRFAMSLSAPDRKRMMAVLRQMEERKKALMPEPHWYLAAIGVDPERQGEGLGSTLVHAGIARAERENLPVYLETETDGNVGFYQHLGFEVIEQVNAIGLDIPVWLMVRPAGSRQV